MRCRPAPCLPFVPPPPPPPPPPPLPLPPLRFPLGRLSLGFACRFGAAVLAARKISFDEMVNLGPTDGELLDPGQTPAGPADGPVGESDLRVEYNDRDYPRLARRCVPPAHGGEPTGRPLNGAPVPPAALV